MIEINHEIFGKIKYDYYWTRKQDMDIFGKKRSVNLLIQGEEDAEFEQAQKDAFVRFFDNITQILKEAENDIYKYYKAICQEYRDRIVDGSADETAPIISSQEEIYRLVEPTDVIFRWSFGKDVRVVGILFDCTWEPEHGLAVKFKDEKVVEVGYQDIVL